MNGQATPQLLTEIQFKVVRKGYDPAEVDAFLERLSVAVGQMQEKLRQSAAAASAAEARAADAARAQAALQGRIEELEGSPAPIVEVSPETEVEQAASVLAMAQRTADAVVNDARTSAAKLVSDAEAEASNIVRDAQSKAEASIGELDGRRRELVADRDALEAFMDAQRTALSADLSRISAVLDDPRALRVAPLPIDLDRADGGTDGSAVDELAVPSSDLPTMATPTVDVTEAEVMDTATATDTADSATISDVESGDEGGLFGGSDDAADEAMRRFFDADFDDDDRFGR